MLGTAKALSVSNTPASAPLYNDSLNISAARMGPMVSTVIVASGNLSFTVSAISRAFRSSGLKMAGRAALFTVPSAFIASLPTARVSGTCLANTMILYMTIYFSIANVNNYADNRPDINHVSL